MMLKKKTPLENITSPWAEDKLDRKEIADYFTRVIDTVRQPFVISLNASYGMGKSFFIKNWNEQLMQEGYKSVYFNAWETDFSESPLLSFMSAVQKQLIHNNEEKEKFKEVTTKGGLYITRKALPILIKGAAKKVINSDEVEELIDLSESTDEEIIDAFGEIAADCLRQQEATEIAISLTLPPKIGPFFELGIGL